MLPKAGGQYVFFREAYGPLFGFLFGWTMFLVVQTGTIAAVSVAFAKFLGVLWPAISGSSKILSVGRFSVSTVQAVGLARHRGPDRVQRDGAEDGNADAERLHVREVRGALRADALGLLLWARRLAGLARRTSGRPSLRRGEPRVGLALARGAGDGHGRAALLAVGLEQRDVRRRGGPRPGQDAAPRAALGLPHRDGDLRGGQRLLSERSCRSPPIQHAPEDRVATAAATALFGPGRRRRWRPRSWSRPSAASTD